MSNRRSAPPDILAAYFQLAASRGTAVSAQALRERIGGKLDDLLSVGAACKGRPLRQVVCPACHEGHIALVEYDAAGRCSWIFCPEAGRFVIDDHRLETVQPNLLWLPDEVSRVLNVRPSPPRRTLIDGAAWWLGDIEVGRTQVSVALAVSFRGAAEVQQLIDKLRQLPPPELGFLLVAGSAISNFVGELTAYHPIAIEDIVHADGLTIGIDQARLSAWVRGLLRGKKAPRVRKGGRPSNRDRIRVLFNERRQRGEAYKAKLAEAKKIRAEWSSRFPDEDAPGVTAIRGHLPNPQRVS